MYDYLYFCVFVHMTWTIITGHNSRKERSPIQWCHVLRTICFARVSWILCESLCMCAHVCMCTALYFSLYFFSILWLAMFCVFVLTRWTIITSYNYRRQRSPTQWCHVLHIICFVRVSWTLCESLCMCAHIFMCSTLYLYFIFSIIWLAMFVLCLQDGDGLISSS